MTDIFWLLLQGVELQALGVVGLRNPPPKPPLLTNQIHDKYSMTRGLCFSELDGRGDGGAM